LKTVEQRHALQVLVEQVPKLQNLKIVGQQYSPAGAPFKAATPSMANFPSEIVIQSCSLANIVTALQP
jgi:hypothetical protein